LGGQKIVQAEKQKKNRKENFEKKIEKNLFEKIISIKFSINLSPLSHSSANNGNLGFELNRDETRTLYRLS